MSRMPVFPACYRLRCVRYLDAFAQTGCETLRRKIFSQQWISKLNEQNRQRICALTAQINPQKQPWDETWHDWESLSRPTIHNGDRCWTLDGGW
jgi:hypothetical protein